MITKPPSPFPALSYKTKERDEAIGDLALRIQSLDNLNETIDEVFELLSRTGEQNLLEELCPYFGVVWPSARALTATVLEKITPLTPEARRELSVLELGCGLAVPSLALARQGIRVTATDFHPEVPRFLTANIELNHITTLTYRPLDWRADVGRLASELGQFDWVIGSDILYERHHSLQVAEAMQACLKPGGRAFLADPARPYLQSFQDAMSAAGFVCDTQVIRAHDEPVPKEIFVLDLARR